MTEAGAGVGLISFNIDRQSYNHTLKPKDEQKKLPKLCWTKTSAKLLAFALNRESYSAQVNGEDAAKPTVRNLFVPPTFVQANGKGIWHSFVEEPLATYGDEWKGIKLDDGQDGLHNTDKVGYGICQSYRLLQKKAHTPIHLDVPVTQNYQLRQPYANLWNSH